VGAGWRGWRTKYLRGPPRADRRSALPLHLRGPRRHPPLPITGTSVASLILSTVVLVVATSRRAVTTSNVLFSSYSIILLVVLGITHNRYHIASQVFCCACASFTAVLMLLHTVF